MGIIESANRAVYNVFTSKHTKHIGLGLLCVGGAWLLGVDAYGNLQESLGLVSAGHDAEAALPAIVAGVETLGFVALAGSTVVVVESYVKSLVD